MEKKHRKLLLKKRLEFLNDLEANDITGYLFQEKIITDNDVELIESLTTRRDRVENLLDLLPRKGPKAFGKFVTILLNSESYKHLGIILEGASGSITTDDCIDAGKKNKRYSDLVIRPRSSSKREPDMLNSYSMISNPRGWCLIINNMHFLTMGDRLGSNRDAANLQSLFTLLGFRVWLVNDVDVDDIREKFNELSQKEDHNDALVVCLLSHGVAGEIYGVDGLTISVSEILDILTAGRSGTLLKDKPKLFLIQACRTDEKSKKVTKKVETKKIHSSETISNPIIEPQNLGRNSPKPETSARHTSFIEQNSSHLHSHMLLGFSTLPGEVSWRNVNHGSYFIDSVVEVFKEYSSSEDVFSMLVKVNEKVREKLLERGQEQIPAPVLTLTKKWYFLQP